MHPVILHTEHFILYTYTVLLAGGILCGLILTWWEGKRLSGQLHHYWNAAFYALWAGIIGARGGYVLANWTYFSEHLDEMARFWKGGLSWYGGLAGGLVALGIYAGARRGKGPAFWTLADALMPALVLGSVWGWLACWMSGCAYGKPAWGPSWLLWNLPDIYGVRELRFATQPLGAGLSLVAFVLLWLIRRRWPGPGFNFLFGLIVLGGMGYLLELTRGDDTLYWGTWRAGQWLSLSMLITGAGILLWRWLRQRP